MNCFLIFYYGELESILPWLYLKKNLHKKNKILIFDNKVIERLKKDRVFTSILKTFNVKITKNNKFVLLLRILRATTIYMSDIDIKNHNLIQILIKILNKRLIIFKHTSTPYYNFKKEYFSINKKFSILHKLKNVTRLVNVKREFTNYKDIGFKKIEIIGNPLEDKRYQNFLNNFKNKFKDYILIFSYGYSSDLFPKNTREYHFKVLLRCIHKYFKNKNIIIKPHPQENTKELKKILLKNSYLKNIMISEENSGLLAKDAYLSIGLVAAGACFQSYFQKKPSINYYLNYNDFYKHNKFRWSKCIVRETITTVHDIPSLEKILFRYKNESFRNKKIYY